jgi:hypothetical protein
MDKDPNFYLMFGRLEGKVDTLLSQQGTMNNRLDEQDERITQLENAKQQQTGFFASVRWSWVVIAAGLTMFADEIKGFIFR